MDRYCWSKWRPNWKFLWKYIMWCIKLENLILQNHLSHLQSQCFLFLMTQQLSIWPPFWSPIRLHWGRWRSKTENIRYINSLDKLAISNPQVWYYLQELSIWAPFWPPIILHWGRKTESIKSVNSLHKLTASNPQLWYPKWYTYKNFQIDLHLGLQYCSIEVVGGQT